MWLVMLKQSLTAALHCAVMPNTVPTCHASVGHLFKGWLTS